MRIVYVGTAHPTHYSRSKAAIQAGKHDLVEKRACMNALEWEDLVQSATTTRSLQHGRSVDPIPTLSSVLRDKLFVEKVLGDIRMVHADFSLPFYNCEQQNPTRKDTEQQAALPDTHRLFDLELGGGALMDTGPYPILMALITLPNHII